MIVTNKTSSFSMKDFVTVELPVTSGLYNNQTQLHSDLNALFSFHLENRTNLPVYQFQLDETVYIGDVAEQGYAALCSALEWLMANKNEIPHYFGEEFCKAHPEFIEYALYTYEKDHAAVYGRWDMAYDPMARKVNGLYEFNGDTPVMLFESVVYNSWLATQHGVDQANDYYHDTIQAVRDITLPGNVAVLGHLNFIEDCCTCEVMSQIFEEGGRQTHFDHIDSLEWDGKDFTLNGVLLANIFALQPWEDIIESCYDDIIVKWREWADDVRFFEPAWRWFISHKGIWRVVTHLLNTNDEYRKQYGEVPLLQTFDEPSLFHEESLAYVEKPVIGRLSSNITVYDADGEKRTATKGVYGESEMIYQEFCPPGKYFDKAPFLVNMWMAPCPEPSDKLLMKASTLAIREFDGEILDCNREQFIPHCVVT